MRGWLAVGWFFVAFLIAAFSVPDGLRWLPIPFEVAFFVGFYWKLGAFGSRKGR